MTTCRFFFICAHNSYSLPPFLPGIPGLAINTIALVLPEMQYPLLLIKGQSSAFIWLVLMPPLGLSGKPNPSPCASYTSRQAWTHRETQQVSSLALASCLSSQKHACRYINFICTHVHVSRIPSHALESKTEQSSDLPRVT